MTEEEKWAYICSLDDELLKGGIILSEWTTYLVKDAEIAFCSGAYLSAILSCQAAIEPHLRFDHFNKDESKSWGFFKLIEETVLPAELKEKLHELRRFRNKWVHVNDPAHDEELLSKPEYHEAEMFQVSKISIRTMLIVLYSNPLI